MKDSNYFNKGIYILLRSVHPARCLKGVIAFLTGHINCVVYVFRPWLLDLSLCFSADSSKMDLPRHWKPGFNFTAPRLLQKGSRLSLSNEKSNNHGLMYKWRLFLVILPILVGWLLSHSLKNLSPPMCRAVARRARVMGVWSSLVPENTNIFFFLLVGIGDPAYFYVENVFLLNGFNMALFFIFGTYLRWGLVWGLHA